MLRVLHVIGKMDRAGAESLIMNLYKNIDHTKIQFDFLVFTLEEGDYDKEILELGGRIYHMPSFKGYNYLDLWIRLKKFFKTHPYKIVHGHIGSLAPAYLFWAKRNGAFTIAHSHATNSTNPVKHFVYWLLSHLVLNISDYFFACSIQAGKDRYGERIIEQSNFEVLKNCIDVEKFKFSEERHTELKQKFGLETKTVFGHVGRFTEAKNHKFLIDVFEQISLKNENAVLMLVGRGELEKSIKNYVEQKQLAGKVKFLGVRNDIPDLMNLFDAFVFTSVFEGLGNVCIEAQAAGLPCFVSSAIQDEAIITTSIWRYPLEWSAEKWAGRIIKTLNGYQRKDESLEVINAGYDVENTAEHLQKFYLRHSK